MTIAKNNLGNHSNQTNRSIMKKVSEKSKDVLRFLVNGGGTQVQDGIMREGRALITRGLAKKKGRFLAITAKGRKFIENQ
ncbi:MAG: hypothetical protein IT440_15625 [Phycisphaeraceae bacterium]|nr:hypothetical protein [Phycisphaeraceae bacterium]